MRIFLFAAASAVSVMLGAARAEDDALERRLKMAAEIVELSQADQLMDQLTDGMLAGQVQAMDVIFKDAGLSDEQRAMIIDEMALIIREELSPALEIFAEQQAPLLAEVYSDEELSGILEFYKSPAGQAMMSKQGELVEKSMALGQRWNTENLPGVLQRMQPRIEAVIEKAKAAE